MLRRLPCNSFHRTKLRRAHRIKGNHTQILQFVALASAWEKLQA